MRFRESIKELWIASFAAYFFLRLRRAFYAYNRRTVENR